MEMNNNRTIITQRLGHHQFHRNSDHLNGDCGADMQGDVVNGSAGDGEGSAGCGQVTVLDSWMDMARFLLTSICFKHASFYKCLPALEALLQDATASKGARGVGASGGGCCEEGEQESLHELHLAAHLRFSLLLP